MNTAGFPHTMILTIPKIGRFVSGITKPSRYSPSQPSLGLLNPTHAVRWQQHRLAHKGSPAAPNPPLTTSVVEGSAARDREWQLRNAKTIANARQRFQTHNLANFVDHYQRLGLGPLTPAEQVREVFFPLAKNFHPDLQGSEDATQFREVGAPPTWHLSFPAILSTKC